MPRRLDETPIPYDQRLSLPARRALEAAKNAKLIAQLARDAEPAVPMRPASAADAADGRTLRGLPAIGRGVQGAIAGSSPAAEVVRRDEQRRRGARLRPDDC